MLFRSIEFRVMREIHLAHSARAKLRDDFIVTKASARINGHKRLFLEGDDGALQSGPAHLIRISVRVLESATGRVAPAGVRLMQHLSWTGAQSQAIVRCVTARIAPAVRHV